MVEAKSDTGFTISMPRTMPVACACIDSCSTLCPTGLIGMPSPLHSDGLVDYEAWQSRFRFFRRAMRGGRHPMHEVADGQGCAGPGFASPRVPESLTVTVQDRRRVRREHLTA